jgi:hypothetical protein
MTFTSLAIWMFSNKDVDNVIIFYVLSYIFDVFTDALKTKHWIADIVCKANSDTMTCKYNIQWSFFHLWHKKNIGTIINF